MSKVLPLEDAIERWVGPGSSLYLTGFTHLIDFAAAHEIVRQRIRDLTLVRLTPDLVYDQLVAAGCASRLVFSYLGNPGVGHLPAIRRAIEAGDIEWVEYTHGSLIAALRAGASNAPFAPVVALGDTDLARHNSAVASVRSPFDGETVAVVAPLRPDVAVVHVQRADRDGNGQVWGLAGDIPEAVHAARHVILTAERIVDQRVLRADPNRTVVLGHTVDAVVESPWAAHPSYAQGVYARDNRFYRAWDEIARSPERLAAYFEDEVFAVPDRAAYAARHRDRLDELAAIGMAPGEPLNLGENAALAAVQE